MTSVAAVRLRRARDLWRRGRGYLDQNGLVATARKVAGWSVQRLAKPRRTAPSAPGDPWSVQTPLGPGALHTCGALRQGRVAIQELPAECDEIRAIEILLATYARSNTNVTELAIVRADGAVLARRALSSATLTDNAYARIELEAPLSTEAGVSLYLVLWSDDGTDRNGVTAYVTQPGRGRFWLLEQQRPLDRIRFDKLPPPSTLGSLVLRIAGAWQHREPVYRMPPLPDRLLLPDDRPRRVGGLLVDPSAGRWLALEAATPIPSIDAAYRAVLADELDVLIVGTAPWSGAVQQLLRLCAERHVPTAFVVEPPLLAVEPTRVDTLAPKTASSPHNVSAASLRRTLSACRFALVADDEAEALARADKVRHMRIERNQSIDVIAQRIASAYVSLHRPKVSIVSILYNKANELPHVLASYRRQSYPGEIEVVFVDDCSPDRSVDVVDAFRSEASSAGAQAHRLEFRVVRNQTNSGNCTSRNVGMRACRGDLIIVIDADCMLNRDFVAAHVAAHAFDDCEVVLGPHNIETGSAEPYGVLRRYEDSPGEALERANLQEPERLESFLNCITRNFSIKREALPAELFAPRFGYSADPESGFGWEDIEFGYRLWKAGARIKFCCDAISVHVSSAPAPEGSRALRSLRNFRRLFEDHPELAQVARAWSQTTYRRILAWADRTAVNVDSERGDLDRLLPPAPGASASQRKARRLRVLTYRWHIPHQWELWKLPIDVTLVTGIGSPMTEVWDYGQRAMPRNARFLPIERVDPREYDLAILHFDENVLSPENTNGVIGKDWGAAFRHFRERIDLPQIAICHGTPQFRGQYDFAYSAPDLLQTIEAERQRLVDYLGDVHVVCNSHQAQREWGFRRSSVIWHGFDPADFPPATHERGILSPLGPLVLSRPHYRGFFLYRSVFAGHEDELRPETLVVPEPHPRYEPAAYAVAKYRRYVDELRKYSVYFNPTLRSPMPRARAEPMMCGVVTVNADNHDVSMFIDNGIDGFYSNDPDQLREYLRYLVRHPAAVRSMGRAARDKAIEVFHIARYLADWRALIAAVG
jgi:glycosyltransferase involved in cell wall biosynthesis